MLHDHGKEDNSKEDPREEDRKESSQADEPLLARIRAHARLHAGRKRKLQTKARQEKCRRKEGGPEGRSSEQAPEAAKALAARYTAANGSGAHSQIPIATSPRR
jgi:hypothetical protein